MTRQFIKPYDLVFQQAKEAMNSLGINIVFDDLQEGIISGSTNTSIWSWGENIDINIKSEGENRTNVDVNSYSKAQLISWGKNNENEESILNELEEILTEI